MLSLHKVFVVALAASVVSALSPEGIVRKLDSLQRKIDQIKPQAAYITVVNAPLIVAGQGPFPEILRLYHMYSTEGDSFNTQLSDTEEITDEADAQSVYDGYLDLVIAHQEVLAILSRKAGLMVKVPLVGKPLSDMLVRIKKVNDLMAQELLQIVFSKFDEIQDEANSLAASTSKVIDEYGSLRY